MKRTYAKTGIMIMLAAMVFTACKVPQEVTCNDETIAFCQCEDGSTGTRECADGQFGDCVCPAPSNAGPCAYPAGDSMPLSVGDDIAKVADCDDGEYVQCQEQLYKINGQLVVGTYCEKIFTNGDVFMTYYPYQDPYEIDCFFLNWNCCNSNSQECLDNSTAQ